MRTGDTAIKRPFIVSVVLSIMLIVAGCGGGAGSNSAGGGSEGSGSTGSGSTGSGATTTALPSTFVRSLNLVPNYIVWDSAHGKLLASMPSTDTVAPNTLIAIDPVTGVVATPVAAGNNPNLLSISSDGHYLWVGDDGDGSVQRFLLPALTKDISFLLPKGLVGETQKAISLRAARVNSHTVGVIAGNAALGNGVYVYDDATPRPTFIQGYIGLGGKLTGSAELDWMDWGKDDSTLYGGQDITIDTPNGIDTLQVTSAGVSVQNVGDGLLDDGAMTVYDPQTGLMYSPHGLVVDPVLQATVGQFYPSPVEDSICTQDSTLSRTYCVVNVYTGVDVNQFELWVYDSHTYGLIQRVSLGSTISGHLSQLVRWGSSGLALATVSYQNSYGPGGLFLFDGAAVNSNGVADETTGTSVSSYSSLTSLSPEAGQAGSDVTVTITGANFTPHSAVCLNCNFNNPVTISTHYVSSTQLTVTIPASALQALQPLSVNVYDPDSKLLSDNSLIFTVYPTASGSTKITAMNLAGLDMAWDAKSALLYVGTAEDDAAHPNSIVAIDPVSGSVSMSQTVNPNPLHLSVSAGGQYLYVGFASAMTMMQLQLPGLDAPKSWPLISPGLGGDFFVGDLKAAPVNPHTTAVALYLDPYAQDYTEVATGGVVIYDDATERPNSAPYHDFSAPSIPIYSVLAWGASDSILGAAQNDNFDLLPFYTLTVNASGPSLTGVYPSFNVMGAEIHSDFGTGLVYSDDGEVADPVSGTIVGSYAASGLVAPDSSLGRVFILGQTVSQAGSANYTIGSFDQKNFTAVSYITVNNIAGFPTELVRWGTSGLALITLNPNGGGMLYIFQDTNFVSSAAIKTSLQATAMKNGAIQQRWAKPSKAEIEKMFGHRQAVSH